MDTDALPRATPAIELPKEPRITIPVERITAIETVCTPMHDAKLLVTRTVFYINNRGKPDRRVHSWPIKGY